MWCAKCILAVLPFFCIVRSAKILGIFPMASVSHQIVYQPIWKELSLRGHEVTVMTTDPLNDPSLTNLTEIDISYMYDVFKEEMDEIISAAPTHWDIMSMIMLCKELLVDPFFSSPEVLSLVNDTSKEFDVLLVEFLWTFPVAFAYKYKCPIIGVAPLGVWSTAHEMMGNPIHSSLYPELITTYGDQLSFYERIDSFLLSAYYRYLYDYTVVPIIDVELRKYFGDDLPSLAEIEKNVSMLFLNTNPVIHKARPYVPGVIEMGRMHIKPKRALPKDLQDFLDKAKEGVIYFSLGSNVKSIHIDPAKRRFIMEVFAELPYKVLWKFEDDHMEGKPDNVKISKWLPQQDLLGHPNIKLFVTQGGLQSTEEAIVNKVPLIGMPFMADQHYNVKRYVTLGIGVHLDFLTFTKDQFKNAILEVLNNPKYKEKIAEVSDILTDEPESGLDRAIWWTEYVIRHKGAPYFKSPAISMPFYQYYLLDVFVFFLAIIFLVVYVVYKAVKFLKSILFNASKTKQKTQ